MFIEPIQNNRWEFLKQIFEEYSPCHGNDLGLGDQERKTDSSNKLVFYLLFQFSGLYSSFAPEIHTDIHTVQVIHSLCKYKIHHYITVKDDISLWTSIQNWLMS